MRIGIAQLNSNDLVQDNLRQIKELIAQARTEKPALLFFPENSLYFRIDPGSAVQAIELEGEEIDELRQACARAGMAIHLTTPIREDGKVFNSTLLIDSAGKAEIVYRKIHLFDIELTGQKPIRESDSFAGGGAVSVSEFGGFKIGHSICYDVRFAELYSAYARAQVDLVAVPAAFLVKTGQAHWEVLLRARAIESQCYVVASAQAGVHLSAKGTHRRETYGHSMLIDPWGEVLSLREAGTGLLFAEVSHEEISRVRGQIPMHLHRRIDF